MNLVVIVRTLNEEKNIERFCKNYQWADQILVADGGSSDDTVKIATSMPKTTVRSFHKRRQMENGLWRNPEGDHLNFLSSWAEEEGADWILQDDCDCFPNYRLKQDTRDLLKETHFGFIYAVRLYLWKGNTHFPHMAKPGKDREWEASLWGWRADLGVRFEDTDMAYTWRPKVDNPKKRLNLLPPYCLMHTSWVDEIELRERLDFYHRSGQIPNIKYPTEYAGPIEPLPDWAREYE
jgi:glycosyltransferase involved in cell wall biosynthesis